MRFSVLSSGSKANCTFLEADGVRILIDCGLSAKETENRLLRIGIAPETLDAIIVTHEHSDHINGVPLMSKRYRLPVFANPGTARSIKKTYGTEKFNTGESFSLRGMKVETFSIVHDAADPVGFAVYGEGLKFVLVTDLGRPTALVRHKLQDANAVVIESNHDHEMLKNCSYPWVLKQRIASSYGHLSNDCAGGLLNEIINPGLSHIVLAHLSENSNTPELALSSVRKYIGERYRHSLIAGSIAAATALVNIAEFEFKCQAVL